MLSFVQQILDKEIARKKCDLKRYRILTVQQLCDLVLVFYIAKDHTWNVLKKIQTYEKYKNIKGKITNAHMSVY